MAKIHGIVFLVLGLIISIVSWRLDRKDFILFIYVGFLFIVIGLVKLILKHDTIRVKKPEVVQNVKAATENVRDQSHSQPSQSHDDNLQKIEDVKKPYSHFLKERYQKRQSRKIIKQHAIKRCLRCHSAMQLSDKYCSKCGARALR